MKLYITNPDPEGPLIQNELTPGELIVEIWARYFQLDERLSRLPSAIRDRHRAALKKAVEEVMTEISPTSK